MSNNPNFVSELVQMARAFEELPQVQADLMAAKNEIASKADTIQRLELRLIDQKTAITELQGQVRKAEVERDHAETMFLETDQKLDSLRHIFDGFKGQVDLFIKASEPVKAVEPEAAQPMSQTSPGSAHEVTDAKPAEGIDAIHDPAYGQAPDASTTYGSGHEVTVESPLVETGRPVPTSGEPPATSTDTVSNTTSPDVAGSSGNTDSGGERPLSGAEPSQSGPTSDARDTASVPSGSEGQSEATPTGASMSLKPNSETEVTGDTATYVESRSAEPQQDDVGYHNEPDIGSNDWLGWYDRMNVRYGNRDGWPARTY